MARGDSVSSDADTRMISPTVVTETRFGYTRFYNSAGRLLAFTRKNPYLMRSPYIVTWGGQKAK